MRPYWQMDYQSQMSSVRAYNPVQEVFSGIGDTGVNLLDAGSCLFPVIAKFDLAAHAALVTCKTLLMFLKTVERRNEALIAHGGKPDNADIDANGCRCRRQRLLNLPFGLNRHEPFSVRLTYGGIADFTQHVPAVSIAQPAKFRQENTAIGLIKLDLFRLGIVEAFTTAFSLEAREVGAFFEKILVGFFQVL